MSIRIVLADDHKILRAGLRAMIVEQPDMEVVGEAENGRVAVNLARTLSPDVVVMDIGMPDLNGIEATRQIVAEVPGVKIIGLSMYSDRRYVAGLFGAGASGYLLKDIEFEELIEAIQAVVAGQVYVSSGVTGVVIEDYVHRISGNEAGGISVLTPREREVLQLLVEGRSTKQIAYELEVSIKTVESHRHRVMEKLDLHNIADLTKYAIRAGLTSLEA
jgi:DNA-binding NarL/FixJ family response regulator